MTTELPLLHLHNRDYTVASRKGLATASPPSPVIVRQLNELSLTGALKAFGLLPNLESRRKPPEPPPIPLTCISLYPLERHRNLLLTPEHHGHPLYDGNSSNLVDF